MIFHSSRFLHLKGPFECVLRLKLFLQCWLTDPARKIIGTVLLLNIHCLDVTRLEVTVVKSAHHGEACESCHKGMGSYFLAENDITTC